VLALVQRGGNIRMFLATPDKVTVEKLVSQASA
jgi:hypothetical protein